MTYRKLAAIIEKNSPSEVHTFWLNKALYDMMDTVEEETGEWPAWTDEVPEWILVNLLGKEAV